MAKNIFYIGISYDEPFPLEGRDYILVMHIPENGEEWYSLVPDNGEGIPGNQDPSIKRYHGFRGSYGGTAKYAEGCRRLEKVMHIETYDTYILFECKLSEDLKADQK